MITLKRDLFEIYRPLLLALRCLKVIKVETFYYTSDGYVEFELL